MTRLLNPDQVAQQLDVSRAQVFTLIHSGKLSYLRVGRFYRIREEDPDAFVEAARVLRAEPGVLRLRPRVRL